MKSDFLKLIFTLAFVLTAGGAFAQQNFGPEWGENATPEERRQNVLIFNYYKDAYDSQRYDDALGYLPQLLENAPKGAQNIYIYAINIYNTKIQRSRDRDERSLYIDSLFTLYDLRMEHFGDHPRYGRDYTIKQKARHYVALKPGDRTGIRAIFEEAIEANTANPDPDFINQYFKELTDDYLSDAIETDDYIDAYDKLSGVMEGITDPAAESAKTTFDALFIQSGAADCESIERIFSARLAEDPGNLDNLSKAFKQLSRLNCHTPFFFDVADRYFRLEPSATTALIIAKAYEKQGDNPKALEYLRGAVDNETDPVSKANLCVQISGMELNANNAQSAANFAKQATQYNPENGYAYMFLAQSYALGSSACEGFDRQTVYWLACDLAQQARRVMSDNPEDAGKAEELMAQYRTAFPSKEEIFFRGLNEGAPYEVKCGWITGRTTVREGVQ